MKPVTLGEILLEDYLKPMGITPAELAKNIGVSPAEITKIINGEQAMSLDMAMLFSKYFGNSVEQWMGIQDNCQLRAKKNK